MGGPVKPYSLKPLLSVLMRVLQRSIEVAAQSGHLTSLTFRVPTVVHVKCVSRNETRFVRSQEYHRGCNLFRLANPALGLGQGAFLPLLAGGIQFTDFPKAVGGLDETGADSITAYTLVPVLC